MNNTYHTPVMLEETIEALNIVPGNWYIDATLGGGGHTKAIQDKGGLVLGIDQDEKALEHVEKNQSSDITKGNLILEKSNFENIREIVKKHGLVGKIDGVLFDFGVSSFQIDEAKRGFSFRRDEPLDMRMNATSGITAFDVVNTWTEKDLAYVFSKYGEEERAEKIAEAIVAKRVEGKIKTSKEFAEVIEKAAKPNGKIHPATRVFMAIRIVVNNELEVIDAGLTQAFEVLNSGGRIAAISFHSLEDRITKRMFQAWEQEGKARFIVKKPIGAGTREVRENKRSRSAKLRVIEKL